MSKGTAWRGTLSSRANVNRAFLSMKQRISQAEAERSIPGRGRVTQTRPRKSFGFSLVAFTSSEGTDSARASITSTLFCKGLLKKSTSTISRKRPRIRLRRDACLWRGIAASFCISAISSSYSRARISVKRAFNWDTDRLSIDCTITTEASPLYLRIAVASHSNRSRVAELLGSRYPEFPSATAP